jgi:hypothetical protein
MYPIELEIKNITDTDRSALYLDLHPKIYIKERLRTKLYDKSDDFNVNQVMVTTVKLSPVEVITSKEELLIQHRPC